MKNINKNFSLIMVCILLQTINVYSQKIYSSIITPLPNIQSDQYAKWSDVFGKRLADSVKIIGLGEFTHGGHETFVTKCEIVKYLIQNKNYRQILLEYPNVILTELNTYLLKRSPGNTDSTSALIKKAYAGIIKDKSFFDLIVWLKQYNVAHTNDMIAVKGIDIEGSDGAFVNYFLYNYFLLFDNKKAMDIIKTTSNSKDSLLVAELNWFEQSTYSFKQKLDPSSYTELVYNARNAKDNVTHKSITISNHYKASVFRDSIMAQNIAYLSTKKSIVLSHNLHVSTSSDVYSAGNFLKRMVGEKYFSILTDFADEAIVWVINENNELMQKHFKSSKKALAAIIKKESGIDEGAIFIEDLKKKKSSFFTNSIDKNGRQQLIGRGVQPFDALIFFNKVTPCL